jgi:hypothetical protein
VAIRWWGVTAAQPAVTAIGPVMRGPRQATHDTATWSPGLTPTTVTRVIWTLLRLAEFLASRKRTAKGPTNRCAAGPTVIDVLDERATGAERRPRPDCGPRPGRGLRADCGPPAEVAHTFGATARKASSAPSAGAFRATLRRRARAALGGRSGARRGRMG